MKKVFILLATYNGEKYLREQIDSLLNQKDIDVFIRVADDRSTDGTAIILEEYKKNPESVLVSLYSTTLADALAQSKDKYAIGLNPGTRQELRLKLNPEPVIKKNEDTAKEEKP